VFARTLAHVLAAPDVDAAVVSGWFGGYAEYDAGIAAAELAAAEAMAAHAAAAGKPVLLHTMVAGGAAAGVLRAAGVPVFRAAEDGIRALGALAAAAERPAPHVPALPPPAPPVREEGYWIARTLLADAGVALPAAHRVTSGDEAAAAAAALGGPVVLKALGLDHKSDVGGVALDLHTPAAVRAAHAAMDVRLHAPAYCVERMADTRDAVELIAGVRRDPRFGPVALLGLGGVFAEVLGDVAFALAPVDAAAALAMLDRLAGAPLLHGARGRPPVDLDAVAAAVAALTTLAAAHPEIAALEVNPLLARPDGCEALDARIVLADHADPRS
jgi:acetate---CoA ligase (ADP-forming)